MFVFNYVLEILIFVASMLGAQVDMFKCVFIQKTTDHRQNNQWLRWVDVSTSSPVLYKCFNEIVPFLLFFAVFIQQNLLSNRHHLSELFQIANRWILMNQPLAPSHLSIFRAMNRIAMFFGNVSTTIISSSLYGYVLVI